MLEPTMPQAVQPTAVPEPTDPRILRSRRMLMDALMRLLARKPFEEISIQEIADEATLNRCTFYLHYPDKNALLQAVTAVRFRDLVASRGLSFTSCEGSVRAIALGLCDYLRQSTACPTQVARMPLEGSLIPVMEGLFLEGAARHGQALDAAAAMRATMASWAVYGAVRQWLESPNRTSAEQVASTIEGVVRPLLTGGA